MNGLAPSENAAPPDAIPTRIAVARDDMLTNVYALRALAALLVVATHVMPHLAAGAVAVSGPAWELVALCGFTAVDVFFVTSGFMIWRITAGRSGWRDASRFLRRRVARIYAGYWPILALATIAMAATSPGALERTRWLMSITLVPWPFGPTAQLLPDDLAIPVAWTLIYELHFYAVMTLVIGAGFRAKPLVPLLAIVVLVAAGLVSTRLGVFTAEAMLGSSLAATLYLSPYLIEFALGAALAGYCEIRELRAPALWLALGALGLGTFAWLNRDLFGGTLNSGASTPTRVLLAAPVATALLAAAVGFDQRGAQPWRRAAIALGESTYAIYLLHAVVLSAAMSSGLHLSLARSGNVVAGYLILAAGIVIASLAYTRMIDRPLYHRAQRLFGVPHAAG